MVILKSWYNSCATIFSDCWYPNLKFVTHNVWKKVPKNGHGVNLVSFWSRKTNLSSENVNAPEQENSGKRSEYKGERRLLTSFWRNWRQKLGVPAFNDPF